jgi:hypothetical protein
MILHWTIGVKPLKFAPRAIGWMDFWRGASSRSISAGHVAPSHRSKTRQIHHKDTKVTKKKTNIVRHRQRSIFFFIFFVSCGEFWAACDTNLPFRCGNISIPLRPGVASLRTLQFTRLPWVATHSVLMFFLLSDQRSDRLAESRLQPIVISPSPAGGNL